MNAVLFIVFMTIFSIFIQGYSFPGSDNTTNLPLIKKMQNPSLYPDDILIQHLERMPFPLYALEGYLAHFMDVQWVLLILQVLARLLLFYACFVLSKTLFKDEQTAYIAIILYALVRGGPLAIFDMTYPELITSEAILPFIIFAFILFLEENYLLMAIILAGVSYVHAITGLLAMAVLGFALLASKKLFKKQVFVSLLLFGLLTLPLFLSILSIVNNNDPLIREFEEAQWIDLARGRVPHHAFPLSWPLGSYVTFGALCLMLLMGLLPLIKKEKHRMVAGMMAGIAMICFAGFIFIEIIPSHTVIRAYPFRSTVFLKVFALIYFAHYCSEKWKRCSSLQCFAMCGALASLSLMPEVFEPRLLLGFLLILISSDIRDKKPSLGLMAGGSAIIILLIFGSLFMKGSLLDLAATLGGSAAGRISQLLLVFVVLMVSLLLYEAGAVLRPSLLLLLMISIGILAIYFGVMYGTSRVDFPTDVPVDAYQEMSYWVRDNTPVDVKVMVNPLTVGFQALSERSVFFEMKTSGQGFFDPIFGVKRWEDLKLMRCTVWHDNCEDFFQTASGEDLRGIAMQVNASLILRDNNHPLRLPIVYRNEGFTLYSISWPESTNLY